MKAIRKMNDVQRELFALHARAVKLHARRVKAGKKCSLSAPLLSLSYYLESLERALALAGDKRKKKKCREAKLIMLAAVKDAKKAT